MPVTLPTVQDFPFFRLDVVYCGNSGIFLQTWATLELLKELEADRNTVLSTGPSLRLSLCG